MTKIAPPPHQGQPRCALPLMIFRERTPEDLEPFPSMMKARTESPSPPSQSMVTESGSSASDLISNLFPLKRTLVFPEPVKVPEASKIVSLDPAESTAAWIVGASPDPSDSTTQVFAETPEHMKRSSVRTNNTRRKVILLSVSLALDSSSVVIYPQLMHSSNSRRAGMTRSHHQPWQNMQSWRSWPRSVDSNVRRSPRSVSLSDAQVGVLRYSHDYQADSRTTRRVSDPLLFLMGRLVHFFLRMIRLKLRNITRQAKGRQIVRCSGIAYTRIRVTRVIQTGSHVLTGASQRLPRSGTVARSSQSL